MEYRLEQLAEHVNGRIEGDGGILISSVAGLEEAGEGSISFLANPKYRARLKDTKASAVIVAPDVDLPGVNLLKVPNPYLAFAQVLSMFVQKHHPPQGIHESCQIGEGVTIGDECAFGAHVVIGNHVTIGSGTIIYPGVVLGDKVDIGSDCILYPNVSVLQDVRLGNRVIVHSGTTIGSDGFGFAPTGSTYVKIPQTGTVVIDDDVEIGANVSIDRATLGETHIHQGVKIDNLVQIAHNVVIGEHSIVVSQVGISGSTKIGRQVTLAGQVGLVGHIEIGDRVVIAAQSGVRKSVPEGKILSGYPAIDHRLWRKSQVSLPKLPEALKTIRALETRIEALERDLKRLQSD
ncbi:UDP-3-O-(3-hydroxymyristoyl)glucosamine N-acyltransferase [candidate division KSB3 bacterium]|uniref:UDP-3-O-acylglucosamine N-acyltransferase n=1 Tax=candidate division KSB3 bacterium TaxID=2044937 RepID=A0A2G6E8L9_9BACT|nr:MAG: UDP-3-O-(3-hydroxymyristoyl)glucosamine N-acyltransferase [candidate division KSB3 bacterium]PIE30468.1 MAG: UDP-3-O-(3-hydroxymyristoyl)glucosamine N-acyltransferase [candidate division KSB3 bacterium]